MIATSNNSILAYNYKILQTRVTSLSFQVNGNQFPRLTALGRGLFRIDFNIYTRPINIYINYGDGNIKKYESSVASSFSNGVSFTTDDLPIANNEESSRRPKHNYTDGNSGNRIITITFENILEVRSISFNNVRLLGVYPKDIIFFENLNTLGAEQAAGLTEFPSDLSNLKKLDTLNIGGSTLTKSSKIPDSFFDLPLKYFRASNSYILSDKISSNLFKLNQWKDLISLQLEDNGITELDETIKELINLQELRLGGNTLTYFPIGILEMKKLRLLYIFVSGSNIPMPNFEIETITLFALMGNFILTDISTKWKKMYSLNNLSIFSTVTIGNTQRMDEFIEQFYILCATNGSISIGGSPAPYKNRFRNITWGSQTIAFTGAKVAPSGYIQGVNNGTPTKIGQRVYVLQNQYGHVVTHATPII